MSKILFNLFYPWIRANLKMAYSMYLDDIDKSRGLYPYPNEADKVRYFMRYRVEEYMGKAFSEHWPRIIFQPHTIICSPELFEYKV